MVYLPDGKTQGLDLTLAGGNFQVKRFDPRNGGALKNGSITHVEAGKTTSLGAPPEANDED